MEKNHYKSLVIDIQGDKIITMVDLGFSMVIKRKLGLWGSRLKPDQARPARKFIRAKIKGCQVEIDTVKHGKRYEAIVWYEEVPNAWVNLNGELITEGYAEEYYGYRK